MTVEEIRALLNERVCENPPIARYGSYDREIVASLLAAHDDLVREVGGLRRECDRLAAECEHLATENLRLSTISTLLQVDSTVPSPDYSPCASDVSLREERDALYRSLARSIEENKGLLDKLESFSQEFARLREVESGVKV